MAVQLEEIAAEALTWPDRARALRITTTEAYQSAAEMLLGIKALRKKVDEAHDPNISRWNKGHKDAIADKAKDALPLSEAERIIKDGMRAYDDEQERLRLAEERRLAEEARQREEDRRLAEAAALEREGHATNDPELLYEANELIERPVLAPVVSIARSTPKVAGIVYRETWKAECSDVKLLIAAAAKDPRWASLLQPNVTAINQMARALKSEFDVPGIRVWQHKDVAAGGR